MRPIKQIKADFPFLSQSVYGKPLIYLDNAATTQKPRQVLDAVQSFYTMQNSNIHRGVHYFSEQASEAYEAARDRVQAFIRAKNRSEIIFTSGTTAAINLIANSFGQAFIKPGDEILISTMEHHSNIVPWQALCEKQGAHLKVIPIEQDGGLDLNALDTLLTDKTKLLTITHVSNALGILNPIQTIIEKAHRRSIPVLVDAAQSIQHHSIDVQALDCDFLVFSGHKIYAETGVGVLYGKEKWLDTMPPYQMGGGMIANVTLEKTSYAELPLKFEAGTPNIAGVLSLAAAIDYLEDVGFSEISAHEAYLLKVATEKIGVLDLVDIYGGARQRTGVLSFNLKNTHPYDVGMILDKMGIAVRTGLHCAEPLMKQLGLSGTIRASFAVYNTIDDIEQLVAGIQQARKMLIPASHATA